jgi:hypothetical protein
MCLIMDEVDGMSGGDRGGVMELISCIKASKIPIICICNDRYNQKLKSLQNYTLDMSFSRPTKPQILNRMLKIAADEGIAMEAAAMECLIETTNNDIRLIINQLQMRKLVRVGAFPNPSTRCFTSNAGDCLSIHRDTQDVNHFSFPIADQVQLSVRRRERAFKKRRRHGTVHRGGQTVFPVRELALRKRPPEPRVPGFGYNSPVHTGELPALPSVPSPKRAAPAGTLRESGGADQRRRRDEQKRPGATGKELSHPPHTASAIAHTRPAKGLFPLTVYSYTLRETDTFFFIVPELGLDALREHGVFRDAHQRVAGQP